MSMTEPQSSSRVVLQQLQTETSPHFQCQSRGTFQPTSVPATPDGGVDAGPCHDTARQTYIPDFPEHSLPQPFPHPSALPQPLKTPIIEHRPDLDLTLSLPADSLSLPSSTVLRTAHNLRLPSFEELGIAVPHPDRIPLQTDQSFSPLGAGPLSKPEDPLHVLSPPLGLFHHHQTDIHAPAITPKAARAGVGHLISTHTPPSEPGSIHWGSFVNQGTAGLGSPPSSDPGLSPNLSVAAIATTPAQAPIIVPTHEDCSDALSMETWIDHVKSTILAESGCLHRDSVKILSHALPCPSTTGHIFGQIIASIHDRSTTATSWINVFHALPGRYTLMDLPKSPPSTPGPAVGGDSYFTSKVFDSAVAIPDYQLDSQLLPPSPRPVVPPGSIDVSIVERYIPPTNTNEYSEMFTFRGRSLLYDRLLELSTDDGILLFIYPTKTGAKTFMQQYLGPILDPLLRTMTVVNDLHSELGRNLGQMASVNYLDEYGRLEAQVRKFCDAMTERQPNSDYNIIYSAKEEVPLMRSAWADDWWIKQEKPRIRDLVSAYFSKTKKLPSSEYTSATMIEEVIKGVSERDYYYGEPTKGVELGIFMVKKTRAPA